MEDLRTIVLSAFICEAASQIGYENVKPKQIEAVLELCKGKDKTNPFLMSLAFPSAQTVESASFYPASAFCIRSKRERAPSSSTARDASAMLHLAISLLISLFIAFLW